MNCDSTSKCAADAARAASRMPVEAPLPPNPGHTPSGQAGEAPEPWRKPVDPELEKALGRLKLEMIHFRATGIGADFLRKELETVLARLNENPEARVA